VQAPKGRRVSAIVEAIAVAEATKRDAEFLSLKDFYQLLLPRVEPNPVYALFHVPTKRHVWAKSIDDLIKKTEITNRWESWYFATASFVQPGSRTQANVSAKRCLYLDIDCGPEKHKRDPDNTYPTAKDGLAAVIAARDTIGLSPTLIVSSGAGLHVYYAVDRDLSPAEWNPLAKALGSKAAAAGLRVDASCTTDSARVLRPVGSLHKNGNRVRALLRVGPVHSPEHLREVLSASETALQRAPGASRAKLDVNAMIAPQYEPTPVSGLKIAEKCAALRRVAQAGGDVPEPEWRAMIGVVKFCVEGVDLAHEWSRGHDSYDPDETQAKFDNYAGTGPTVCASFARFNPKACASCEFNGKITTPCQLGKLSVEAVEALPPEQKPAPVSLPQWLQYESERFAVVRYGSKIGMMDFKTPVVMRGGFRNSMAPLDLSAYRSLRSNVFTDDPVKPVPVATAYLAHPRRRQYDAVTFAPGEPTPPNILNTYQGFGVEPVAGDVSPWQDTLSATVTHDASRKFVLNWLAWKVQHPGGVPGTILVFTGAKGTGKNSLFEPIVEMFGLHGRMFDDAEQVAGRFTGHLQSVAFAVLDEALFAGDPRQADRIKARVTATHCTYESKGLDPVQGVNRAAYVSLSNHAHVWQATIDERRAVVVESADTLRGNTQHWARYYSWLNGGGSAHLLRHLQGVDVRGFNPRVIPQTPALARQIELTALKSPAAAWWHTALSEGWLPGSGVQRAGFDEVAPTRIASSALRESFERHAGSRRDGEWAAAMRKIKEWVPDMHQVREAHRGARERICVFPPLDALRASFSASTGITFDSP